MKKILWLFALVIILTTTGCIESHIVIIPAEESIRVKSLEGIFILLPDDPGEGLTKIGGGQLNLQWDYMRKFLFFDREPRLPDQPNGMRASDILYNSLRILPLNKEHRIYLMQMININSSIQDEMGVEPTHCLGLIQIDEEGIVRAGDDESWFSGIKGFSEAMNAKDPKRALQLVKDNVSNLPKGFFTTKLLVPVNNGKR